MLSTVHTNTREILNLLELENHPCGYRMDPYILCGSGLSQTTAFLSSFLPPDVATLSLPRWYHSEEALGPLFNDMEKDGWPFSPGNFYRKTSH